MTAPARDLPRGLTFEELPIGASFLSHGRTLCEADVCAFAGLSGDWNPLHVDQPRAARSAFRGRVAHGLLVQSIASGLAMQTGVSRQVNYTTNRVAPLAAPTIALVFSSGDLSQDRSLAFSDPIRALAGSVTRRRLPFLATATGTRTRSRRNNMAVKR